MKTESRTCQNAKCGKSFTAIVKNSNAFSGAKKCCSKQCTNILKTERQKVRRQNNLVPKTIKVQRKHFDLFNVSEIPEFVTVNIKDEM